MGWNHGSGSGGSRAEFVMEGQVPLYVFTETPTRVRFLTEDYGVEDLMQELGVVREQAEEVLNTKVIHERWVQPVARWEHQIKEIPGKRYFSTMVCRGRQVCELCQTNEEAKAQGVSENKMLPFPVRKRFFVPAWFYDMKRVLYVRAAEDFFDDVATYVNRSGSACDFDIYKQGKGLNTKYKVVYVGPSKDEVDLASLTLIKPKDLNFTLDAEEWERRVNGRPAAAQGGSASAAEQKPAEYAVPPGAGPATAEPVQQPAKAEPEFTIPFGSNKGRTFKELLQSGDRDYILFLAKNGSGEVQKRAQDFARDNGL